MKKWEIVSSSKFKIQSSKEDILDVLLQNREIKDEEEFLHPDISKVTLKSVGIDEKQVEEAVTRIQKAYEKKEQMIVYGDYDVDGITASAIIWETLHESGARIMPYIPSRMEEGYGLSVAGITNLLKKHPDTKLIITVDNGIVAYEAVDFANAHGIDVIVTDHHVEGLDEKVKLHCYALVHTTKLCGAGIAWLLAQSIRHKISGSKYQIENDTHLELAALGTVADLVPLTEANRAIVKFGIEKLWSTKRPGLLALLEEADTEQGSVGVYQIGHIIAPRLNASGRIEHGMDSLRLLCTKDRERAGQLAVKIGVTNRERQIIMRNATDDAVARLKRDDGGSRKLLFIDNETYQEGVIGLVAGKLVEEFYRPSIVISKKEKLSKGSVRSVSGFNIIEFLRTHGGEHFVNVGGHPMAAGFTIETDKIPMVKNILELKAEELITQDVLQRVLKVDCEIPLGLISPEFYRALQTFSPFGMGNPEPVFMSEVVIREKRLIGKERNHLKLIVESDGVRYDAVAFGMGEKESELTLGEKIKVAYVLDENEWNGQRKLQLKVKDLRV